MSHQLQEGPLGPAGRSEACPGGARPTRSCTPFITPPTRLAICFTLPSCLRAGSPHSLDEGSCACLHREVCASVYKGACQLAWPQDPKKGHTHGPQPWTSKSHPRFSPHQQLVLTPSGDSPGPHWLSCLLPLPLPAQTQDSRLGSSLRPRVPRLCQQHSRCWQPDRRVHLVCVKTFFPEDLAGCSLVAGLPTAASGSNGIFLLSQGWGLVLSLCFSFRRGGQRPREKGSQVSRHGAPTLRKEPTAANLSKRGSWDGGFCPAER